MNDKHQLVNRDFPCKCPAGYDSNCLYCDGGLSYCSTCHGGEATLPTECPGRPLTAEEQDAVGLGLIDHVAGTWIRPARWVAKRYRQSLKLCVIAENPEIVPHPVARNSLDSKSEHAARVSERIRAAIADHTRMAIAPESSAGVDGVGHGT